MMNDRKTWEIPRLRGEVWYCGDEVCDCHQPQIELIQPHLGYYPWISHKVIWEGDYKSEPSVDEMAELCRSLHEECTKRSIPCVYQDDDVDHIRRYERPATEDEIRDIEASRKID